MSTEQWIAANPVPMTAEDADRARARLRAKVWSFARTVAPLYAVLRWTWAVDTHSQQAYIPGAADIARVLTRLIDDAIVREEGFASATGGLRVWAEMHADGSIDARLVFEVEADA